MGIMIGKGTDKWEYFYIKIEYCDLIINHHPCLHLNNHKIPDTNDRNSKFIGSFAPGHIGYGAYR